MAAAERQGTQREGEAHERPGGRCSSRVARAFSAAGAWSSCCVGATACARPCATSPARTEVRAGVATAGRRRRPARVLRRRPAAATSGWAEAVAGCDYVLHVASPFPPDAAEGPRRADRAGARGHAAGAARGPRRRRRAASSSPPRWRRSRGSATRSSRRALTEEDWTDPDDPKLTPYARSKTLAERAAWDLSRERGAEERWRSSTPGRSSGPLLGDGPLLLARAGRAAAEGRCPGCRGSASASSTCATSPSCRSRR